jgi:hypothetical protein
MKKKMKILSSGLVLMLALAVGACMTEELPPDMLNADAESISVVTAVQLGAVPGCHGMSLRISGNVTKIKLEEDDEMALVLEDGDPLCLDTFGVIEDELISLEGNLQDMLDNEEPADDIGDIMREAQDYDGLKETGGSGTDGSPLQVDPNPQPAGEVATKTALTTSIVMDFSSGSSGTSSPAPGGNVPAPPHSEGE